LAVDFGFSIDVPLFQGVCSCEKGAAEGDCAQYLFWDQALASCF